MLRMIDPGRRRGWNIADFALHHGKVVILAVAGMCLMGFYALSTLPSGIYPDVAFPRIVVIAERGEEGVESMMIGVTRPIEEAVNAIPGLKRVRSKTIRGASEFSLDFLPTANMQDALSQSRARVSQAVSDMPDINLTIEQQTPSVFPVISFNVALDKSTAKAPIDDPAALNDWAQVELKPRFTRLPDVFMVSVQGAQTRQVIVEVDPAKLSSASLSMDDVVNALRDANAVGAVGMLERDYRQFQLLVSGELKSLDEIGAVPVAMRGGAPILLSDVAKVSLGAADRTSVVTGNGDDAVVLSIFMRFGGKVTNLSDSVTRTLDQVQPLLPPGVSIHPVYDQAHLVRESLAGVRDAIGIGMLLAIGVLWVFLRSMRLTLIAGITIPISILGTFALMSLLGESLNLMSLGGIAVAVGLIIDDAIVVVENIARRLLVEKDRRAAAVDGVREIFGAVVGSSLTTIVVFIPLVLLEGIVGQFFRALALALAVGIAVSMVISLTLTPLMCASALGPRPSDGASAAWMDSFAARIGNGVRYALVHRLAFTLALAVLLLGAGFIAAKQETGFLPEMDEGGYVLDYTMPVGASLGETDRNCRAIEKILRETPDVASFSRRTGAELGFFATEQFSGDFLIGLKPKSQRRDGAEISEELRSRINTEIPQIEISFVQIMQDTINDLAGNASPIEVKVFGTDYHRIQSTAEKVAAVMEKIPGIVDVSSGVSFGSPEITWNVDRVAASRAGLDASSINERMRAALLGVEATKLRRGERLLPVLVRYPDGWRRNEGWLQELPIANAAGRAIPISSVAHIEEKLSANELSRENQQPVVSVESNITGGDLGGISRKLSAALASIPLPAGVRFEIAGQIESQAEAFRNLLLVLGLGCGLVWLLLVAQFRSYRLPLIIFLTVPPSQIGALLALRLTGTPLNISSFMGMIMLVGLVVKNGIIFIEYTAQLREEGMATLEEALSVAARVRLRPILMTSLAAIFALLPLAFNLGSGAELQRPLAIAVIGGLSVSTVFTLLIVPIAHSWLGEPSRERVQP
ncbi:efflux RND transporter permease subunit [soil metagenome]